MKERHKQYASKVYRTPEQAHSSPSATTPQQVQVCRDCKAAATPQAAEGRAPTLVPLSRVGKESKKAAQPKPYAADRVGQVHPPNPTGGLRAAPAALALPEGQQGAGDEQAAA